MSEIELLTKGLLYVGERNIVRERERFKIYLPKNVNTLWQELAEKGRKVKVYIKIET